MNPYDVLQVSPKADSEVIRAAYRSLMQRFHPDRNADDPHAAEMAAQITRAYDLLADPQRKAAYDAQAKQALMSLHSQALEIKEKNNRNINQSTLHSGRTSNLLWLLILVAVLLMTSLIWFAATPSNIGRDARSVEDKLTQLREKIESPTSSEALRQQLFMEKENLLQNNPNLQKEYRQSRLNDLAGRSMTLLDAPISVRIKLGIGELAPTALMEVPEITLVLGSFDTQKLSDQVIRHRQRITQDVHRSLSTKPIMWATHSDAEVRLKSLIRDSVMQSLELRLDEAYPTTFFESPGRYGVVEVLLPQSYSVRKAP